MLDKSVNFRRKSRNRLKLKRVCGQDRKRLTVFRSNNNIYAQIVDDKLGKTLVSASSLEKEIQNEVPSKSFGNIDAAVVVGSFIARRAKDKNISLVYFDRGLYLYHGRIKAFAESARAGGLLF